MLRPEDKGWLVVGAVPLVYEGLALWRGWPLLSHAMDRYRSRLLRRIVIDSGLTVLFWHVTRRVPPRYDLVARVANFFGL